MRTAIRHGACRRTATSASPGPDLLTVKVVDGVATEVEPNFCAAAVHPGGGKVCVKAFGLVQKTYNPHRVLHADEADQSEEGPRRGPAASCAISWDEAFDADRRTS